MFSIGEHVIHPGQGVCRVIGFKESPSPMIMLESKQGHAKTRMMYPLAQSDRLRPCISKAEAKDLIENYDELECDPFTGRNSSLEETHFKQELKRGAPSTLRVAKTMRTRIREAEERNKKPSSYYSRVLKEAHRRAVEELAVALKLSEDTVSDRIEALLVEDESSLN
ncbi:CarD family transcriptional regulator [Collinsella sp. AGMB00827]|uniref:CarD family transcriptional regulator n=1 Tax=Collinsella ureilytica TaxID=2869515 RepID=A0ABS7MKJ7_9ACTN|nr:CarD family transcriptional regulator [Collinsella urealyticum]MBY4797896.1 CarD family transcriptional regulator [Collinsella urealyticum]